MGHRHINLESHFALQRVRAVHHRATPDAMPSQHPTQSSKKATSIAYPGWSGSTAGTLGSTAEMLGCTAGMSESTEEKSGCTAAMWANRLHRPTANHFNSSFALHVHPYYALSTHMHSPSLHPTPGSKTVAQATAAQTGPRSVPGLVGEYFGLVGE